MYDPSLWALRRALPVSLVAAECRPRHTILQLRKRGFPSVPAESQTNVQRPSLESGCAFKFTPAEFVGKELRIIASYDTMSNLY
jgi:hypothetical protein